MNIQVEFELTFEDWKEAMWLHRRRGAPADQPLRWLNYFGLGAASLGFVLLVQRLDGGGWVAPLALILMGLLVPLQLISVRNDQINQAWAKAQRLIHPTTWRFDESGVRCSGVHWEITYHWTAFTSWIEGPAIIALYASADQFHTIPKRAFADPQQLNELRRLLDTHMITASTGGFPVKRTPPAAS